MTVTIGACANEPPPTADRRDDGAGLAQEAFCRTLARWDRLVRYADNRYWEDLTRLDNHVRITSTG